MNSKILFMSRATLFSSPGGDTIQLLKTADELRLLGLQIDIHLCNEVVEYSNYDLIHFFNIIRPADILPHIHHNIPFVVSTIYVDYSEFEKKARGGLFGRLAQVIDPHKLEYIKVILRSLKGQEKIQSWSYFFEGQYKSIQRILNRSAYLLPNSNSEYDRVSKDFKCQKPYRAIVNAIDLSIFDLNCHAQAKYSNSVVCVGRVEGRKNQLNLIRALNGAPYSVYIVGKPSPNTQAYFEQCVQEAQSNVFFIDHCSPQEVASILKAAKVHALASWFETTGLCSLEAAAMNCNVVISDKGDQREYFGDDAFYCNPEDIKSIRSAVDKAFATEVNYVFGNFVRNNYIWQKTAEQTFAVYNEVLDPKV